MEQIKKKQRLAPKAKKEAQAEPPPEAEVTKVEEAPETEPAPVANVTSPDETKGPSATDSKAEEETVSELGKASHGRQPSLSLQSKMRSSSFRQSSGGPLSPSYGFAPDGDTAPDIFRKQAIKIEELEKENRRLAKETSDGEKRWKKAEEELEELREAEDDSTSRSRDPTPGTVPIQELEKLVSSESSILSHHIRYSY